MRTLILDVETSPMIAYVWARRDVNIALNQIKSDWYIIAWSAKWLGEPAKSIIYRDQRGQKDLSNDKEILTGLWRLLDQADIVITQNGQSFDGPKINARFILNGMNPPSPYQHLDTYRIARRVFQFTSNKLEYLTDKLCTKYKKLSHGKFPGMELWKECLKDNKEAWNEMKKYNIHDVLSTEELYIRLRAWAPETMVKAHIVKDNTQDCATCGAKSSLYRNGVRVTKTGRYPRFVCNQCGVNTKGAKINEKDK